MTMKYLLVVLVVLFAIWLWRHNRREPPQQTHRQPPPPAAFLAPPQDMVACAHCGLHLPLNDAVPGARVGVYYCGQAHRLQGDGQS